MLLCVSFSRCRVSWAAGEALCRLQISPVIVKYTTSWPEDAMEAYRRQDLQDDSLLSMQTQIFYRQLRHVRSLEGLPMPYPSDTCSLDHMERAVLQWQYCSSLRCCSDVQERSSQQQPLCIQQRPAQTFLGVMNTESPRSLSLPLRSQVHQHLPALPRLSQRQLPLAVPRIRRRPSQ